RSRRWPAAKSPGGTSPTPPTGGSSRGSPCSCGSTSYATPYERIGTVRSPPRWFWKVNGGIGSQALPGARLRRRRDAARALRRHGAALRLRHPRPVEGDLAHPRRPLHALPGRGDEPGHEGALDVALHAGGHARRDRAVPVVLRRVLGHPADDGGDGGGGLTAPAGSPHRPMPRLRALL